MLWHQTPLLWRYSCPGSLHSNQKPQSLSMAAERRCQINPPMSNRAGPLYRKCPLNLPTPLQFYRFYSDNQVPGASQGKLVGLLHRLSPLYSRAGAKWLQRFLRVGTISPPTVLSLQWWNPPETRSFTLVQERASLSLNPHSPTGVRGGWGRNWDILFNSAELTLF